MIGNVLLLLSVMAVATLAQTTRTATELRVNEPFEGALANEPHEYQITLRRNEFVQIQVEQQGIDVVLRLYSPSHALLKEMDSPTGPNGPETLSWITEEPGNYRFTVQRVDEPGNSPSGKYVIRLVARDLASETNRRRVEAEALFVKVFRPRPVLPKELPELIKNCEALLKVWNEVGDDYVVDLINKIIVNLKNQQAKTDAFAREEAKTDAKLALEESGTADRAKLMVQTGHSSTVESVAFSPSGKILASLGSDSVILWDVDTGQQLKALSGSSGLSLSLAFSPDSSKLAIGRRNGSILLLDARNGQRLKFLQGHDAPMFAMAFLPDGKTLASMDAEMTITLWNIDTGQQIRSSQIPERLLGFSDDGRIFIKLTANQSIALVDTETGNEVKQLAGPATRIRSVTISKNGKRVASLDLNNITTIWNADSGERLRSFKGQEQVTSQVAFSPDGRTLATGGIFDQRVNLWDVETGARINGPNVHVNGTYSLTFSPDGQVLACGVYRAIELWNLAPVQKNIELGGQAIGFSSVRFSPDGKYVLGGTSGRSIKLWDAATSGQLRSFAESRTLGDVAEFSPDGKLVAWLEDDPDVKGAIDIVLWDQRHARRFNTLKGHTGDVSSIAFSADSKTLVSGSLDGTIKVWNIDIAQAEKSFSADPYAGILVAFSQAKTFATAGSKDLLVTLRDSDTGTILKSLSGLDSYAEAIAFSPDGKTLAVGSREGSVHLWNVESGHHLTPLVGHLESVTALAFSPDGKVIASVSLDQTIKLWSIGTGELMNSFTGHTSFIKSVTFSPNGKFLVTGSADGTIKLWQLSGDNLATLIALNDNDWAVVTPNGLFDASPGARKLMHYVVGLEPIRLEQMKDTYYVPGLLQKIINGTELPNKVTLFSARDLFPLVEYQPPKPNETSFQAKLLNRGGGIGHTQLFVNGKECGKESGVETRPADFNRNQQILLLQVDLGKCGLLVPDEENRVELVTQNVTGTINSRGSTRGVAFNTRISGPLKLEPPHIYAIVAGISDYASSKLYLRYAASDAENFASVLEIGATKLVGADRVHIRLLTSDSQVANVRFGVRDAKATTATKRNLESAFTEFEKATPKDVFIVYFAGHGVSINLNQDSLQMGGDTYLYLTQEATTTDLGDGNLRQAMALSSDELAELMKHNKALKQVLILDTCAAGAAAGSLAKRDIPSDQIKAIDRLQNRIGFFVLMGSAADKASYETTRYGHGLLTYSLLQGFKGGARLREDKFADVASLFSYAQDAVPELAIDVGGIQRPIVISPVQSAVQKENGSFDIGMFTAVEQALITLPTPRPWVLGPVLINLDENFDSLRLTPLLREALRAATEVAFIEADEMSGAVKPSGSYRIKGHSIIVTLKLIRNGIPVGKTIVIKSNDFDAERLIKQLVKAISAQLLTEF